jgi:parvulin-like peptidyl-prolyl isomerase
MPELYEAASQAEVGQLTGPIAVHDGYSVFEVIDHQRGTLAEFVRVERRATGMAAKQMQTEHFEAFVDRLLDKYEDVVSVYPEELVRALPDSLLKRISAG